MRLLQRNAHVTTRFGGKFVQSINGVAGRPATGGDPVRLVLLRQRHRERRRRDRDPRPRRRPRLVGLPRLERRDGHAGRRRFVPRAVRARRSTARSSRRASSARRPTTPACDRPRSDNLVAVGHRRGRGRSSSSDDQQDTLRVLVGDWRSLRHDPPRAAREAGRRRAACSRAWPPTGARSRSTNAHGDVARTARRRAPASSPRCAISTGSRCGSSPAPTRPGIDAAAAALRRGRCWPTTSRSPCAASRRSAAAGAVRYRRRAPARCTPRARRSRRRSA